MTDPGESMPPQPWRYRAWDFLFNHSPLPSFLPLRIHLRWSKWALRHLDMHWVPVPSGSGQEVPMSELRSERRLYGHWWCSEHNEVHLGEFNKDFTMEHQNHLHPVHVHMRQETFRQPRRSR